MNWYLKVMTQNYANFSGRARRKEYWMWYLFYFIMIILATIIDLIIGSSLFGLPYGICYLLVGLAHFVPGLAAAVRRLHDVGKSGWFLLIGLIPLLGAIWLLVLFLIEGEQKENEYGANPKD